MSLKKSFKKEHVKKAIEILGAECFGALQMCNSIGGVQTPEWEIIHNNTWEDIVEEGQTMGLDFNSMECAVTKTPLMWSGYIQNALGLITIEERRKMFNSSVKVDGNWPEPSKVD